MELGCLILVLLELLELLDNIAGEFLGPCFCCRLDRFSIWAFLPCLSTDADSRTDTILERLRDLSPGLLNIKKMQHLNFQIKEKKYSISILKAILKVNNIFFHILQLLLFYP